jgi:hypothetical protein
MQTNTDHLTGEIRVATFDDENRLIRPDNVDEWVLLGVSVGHGYPKEGEEAGFTLDNPGKMQVIQMEPGAYNFFKENKYYANGTMISLAFYETLEDPEPEIDGLAQGELATFEIHLLHKEKYPDDRAFFVYRGDEDLTAKIEPQENRCVQCHMAEGDFDGTFSQFYPAVRDILSERKD